MNTWVGTSNSTTVTTPLSMTGDGRIIYVMDNSTSQDAAGVEQTFKVERKADNKISARLYFKYVKSKFTKLEKEELKRRLSKLQKMVSATKDIGQQALYEKLSEAMAIAVRESESVAVGVTQYVDKKVIDKFRGKVKNVYLEPLEKFPRTIPAQVQRKIKRVLEMKLFDEYFVLFLDYTKEELPKTNKEKIREKDPILFGCFQYAPDKYYPIVDWVDDFCDLTFDKFIEKIKEDDIDFEPSKIEEMSDEYFEKIKLEVAARHDRLHNAKRSNYRDLMTEEDKIKLREEIIAEQKANKKSWWKKIFKR